MTDLAHITAVPPNDLAEQVRRAFLGSYRRGKTLEAYTRDLNRWFRWCDRVGVDPLAVRRQHIEVWVREIEQTVTRSGHLAAPATVHRAVSVVRCFYGYAVDAEILFRNPVPGASKPLHLAKVSSASQTLGLDRMDASILLGAAREHSARNGAIVSLLLHQGFRIAEVCGLNTEDLGTSRSHNTISVLRKGGERQTVALAPVAAADVDRWLAERPPSSAILALPGEVVAGSQPLFIAFHGRHAGQRIKYWHVEEVVRRAAKQAGITKRLSPHSLRHTCITQALNEGVPLRDVQRFAGHADPKTTVRYDRARDDLDRSPAYKLSGVFG